MLERAAVARSTVCTADVLTEIAVRVGVVRVHAWDLFHDAEPHLDAVVGIAGRATHIEAIRFRITATTACL